MKLVFESVVINLQLGELLLISNNPLFYLLPLKKIQNKFKIKNMKTKIFTYISIASLLCIMAISCQSPQKKVENAQEEVEKSQQDLKKAQNEFNIDYQKFKLENENEILDNEKKINELKEKKINVKKEEKVRYNEKITELEQKNNELKSKINTYQFQSKDKWESFKKEFNHDMNDLGQAIKDLFKDNVKN